MDGGGLACLHLNLPKFMAYITWDWLMISGRKTAREAETDEVPPVELREAPRVSPPYDDAEASLRHSVAA